MKYVFDTTVAPQGRPEEPVYTLRQLVKAQGIHYVGEYTLTSSKLGSYEIVGYYHPDGPPKIKEWLAKYPHPRNSKVHFKEQDFYIIAVKKITSAPKIEEIATAQRCNNWYNAYQCSLTKGHKQACVYFLENSTTEAKPSIKVKAKVVESKRKAFVILSTDERKELEPFVSHRESYSQHSMWDGYTD